MWNLNDRCGACLHRRTCERTPYETGNETDFRGEFDEKCGELPETFRRRFPNRVDSLQRDELELLAELFSSYDVISEVPDRPSDATSARVSGQPLSARGHVGSEGGRRPSTPHAARPSVRRLSRPLPRGQGASVVPQRRHDPRRAYLVQPAPGREGGSCASGKDGEACAAGRGSGSHG